MVAPQSFTAKLDDARILANVLRPIAISEKTHVSITSAGARFSTQKSKTVQASVLLARNFFREFSIPAEAGDDEEQQEFSFWISVGTVLDCLNLYGHANAGLLIAENNKRNGNGRTSVKLGYASQDGLELTLTDDGITTDCKLATYDDDEIEHWDFQTSDTVSKLIILSSYLGEALKEADDLDTLEIFTSPVAPYFRVSGANDSGSVSIEYQKDTDVVEYFSASVEVRHSYKMDKLMLKKSLATSNKTSLRINEEGVLSLQLMIPLGTTDATCIVQYLFVAQVDGL